MMRTKERKQSQSKYHYRFYEKDVDSAFSHQVPELTTALVLENDVAFHSPTKRRNRQEDQGKLHFLCETESQR